MDIQFLSKDLDLNKAIKAKTDIQNAVLANVTREETLLLASDMLPETQVNNVKAKGKSYLTSRKDTDFHTRTHGSLSYSLSYSFSHSFSCLILIIGVALQLRKPRPSGEKTERHVRAGEDR